MERSTIRDSEGPYFAFFKKKLFFDFFSGDVAGIHFPKGQTIINKNTKFYLSEMV
jgi:hypothetical protein